MMWRLIRCGIVALALLASLPTASAQSDEVVALFERGLNAYRLANYEEAERLFAQAHALEPLADLSYNHARTLELLGRFGEAADIYARFLDEAPDAEDRDVIQARIQNLRHRHARESTAPRRVAERAVVEVEEPVEATPPPGPSLAGPLMLMGGGFVVGAGGILSGLAASNAHDEAMDPETSQVDTDAANRRATTLARTTTALFVVGGAAFAAGATWLFIKLAGGPGDEAVSLQVAPTGVALEGSF